MSYDVPMRYHAEHQQQTRKQNWWWYRQGRGRLKTNTSLRRGEPGPSRHVRYCGPTGRRQRAC